MRFLLLAAGVFASSQQPVLSGDVLTKVGKLLDRNDFKNFRQVSHAHHDAAKAVIQEHADTGEYLCNLLKTNYDRFMEEVKVLLSQPQDPRQPFILKCDIPAENLKRFFDYWFENLSWNTYPTHHYFLLPRLIVFGGDQILKLPASESILRYLKKTKSEYRPGKYHEFSEKEFQEAKLRGELAAKIYASASFVPNELFYKMYKWILEGENERKDFILMITNSPRYLKLARQRYRKVSFEQARELGKQFRNRFEEAKKTKKFVQLIRDYSANILIGTDPTPDENSDGVCTPLEKIEMEYFPYHRKPHLQLRSYNELLGWLISYGNRYGYVMPGRFKKDLLQVIRKKLVTDDFRQNEFENKRMVIKKYVID